MVNESIDLSKVFHRQKSKPKEEEDYQKVHSLAFQSIPADLNSISTNQRNSVQTQTQTRTRKSINMERFIKRFYSINNQYVREFFAEMVGSTLLVLFGCASVAQYKLRKEDPTNNPIFLTINLTFGFGIILAILITAKTSGGHLNPAVSFASFLMGRMSFLRFLVYTLAQFFGSFIGAVLVYLTYLDALNAVPNKFTVYFAGIFTTFPQDNLSTLGAVFDQAIGTFLLITVYLAMIDKRNNTPEDGLHWAQVALSMGLAVTVIGMSFGYNSAYAINPARDFSPRLFTLIAGWGPQVFTAGNYFFWIPLIVPMFSAFLACFFYIILIDNVR